MSLLGAIAAGSSPGEQSCSLPGSKKDGLFTFKNQKRKEIAVLPGNLASGYVSREQMHTRTVAPMAKEDPDES